MAEHDVTNPCDMCETLQATHVGRDDQDGGEWRLLCEICATRGHEWHMPLAELETLRGKTGSCMECERLAGENAKLRAAGGEGAGGA